MNISIDNTEQAFITIALDLQIKSLERAAKSYELQGRKAAATAIREELAAYVKLNYKVRDADQKTPQAKA